MNELSVVVHLFQSVGIDAQSLAKKQILQKLSEELKLLVLDVNIEYCYNLEVRDCQILENSALLWLLQDSLEDKLSTTSMITSQGRFNRYATFCLNCFVYFLYSNLSTQFKPDR